MSKAHVTLDSIGAAT